MSLKEREIKDLEYYKSKVVAYRDNKYLSGYEYIVEHKPKFIVEYGGGKSTFDITELVNFLDYGGKVVGYESDEHWYNTHIEEGWNFHNNLKLVNVVQDEYDGVSGVRYVHPIEDIVGVDFIILDGPELTIYTPYPDTTFNIMDIVDYTGQEIPYFIDGRTGAREFYKDKLGYTTDIGDKKEDIPPGGDMRKRK
jgi:hypothetical protein